MCTLYEREFLYLGERRNRVVQGVHNQGPNCVRHQVVRDAAQHLRARNVEQVVQPVLIGVARVPRRRRIRRRRLVPELLEIRRGRRGPRVHHGVYRGGAWRTRVPWGVAACGRPQGWFAGARRLDLGSTAA